MTTNHCPIQKFLTGTLCKQNSANACSHCCILLLRYRDGVETAVKGVEKTFVSDDSGNAAM